MQHYHYRFVTPPDQILATPLRYLQGVTIKKLLEYAKYMYEYILYTLYSLYIFTILLYIFSYIFMSSRYEACSAHRVTGGP